MKTFNVPILLIFFCRPEVTSKVFDCIRKVQPSKLYLYQDGPRNERDLQGIMQCRDIVSNIDWDCDVKTYYQEQNVGCDPSEYIAQKWMFEQEEMGIVLEDDDVVSHSFFYFCKELLEKYKDDERINMICGMNHLGKYNQTDADYFFARSGSITGWASWKRVVDTWDPNYSYFEDPYAMKCLEDVLGHRAERTLKTWKYHKDSGKEFYETILGASATLNHRLNIVPTKNMVANIGVVANATHSVASVFLLPRRTRRIFYKEIYEYDFPLKHPKYVVEDMNYTKKIWDMPGILRQLQRIEGRIYKLFPALGQMFSDDLKRRVDFYSK